MFPVVYRTWGNTRNAIMKISPIVFTLLGDLNVSDLVLAISSDAYPRRKELHYLERKQTTRSSSERYVHQEGHSQQE